MNKGRCTKLYRRMTSVEAEICTASCQQLTANTTNKNDINNALAHNIYSNKILIQLASHTALHIV